RSGIDQHPLDKSKAVPFQSPPELAVEFERPNGEPIRGMGIPEGGNDFGKINNRLPQPGSFEPRKGHKVKIKAQGIKGLQFGKENINLHYVEQLVEPGQTRAIGDMIYFALQKEYISGRHTLKEIITLLDQIVDEQGLEVFSPDPLRPNGDYSRPRSLELAAAINRLRSLLVHVHA
ncbi:MAG: P-loop domain-containing protein, partial [Bacillota bacterium]